MRGTMLVSWETRVLCDGTRVTRFAVEGVVVETAPRPIGAVIDVAPVRESARVLELRRAA
jgi:hypothetical protein